VVSKQMQVLDSGANIVLNKMSGKTLLMAKDLVVQEKQRDKHRHNQQKAHIDDVLYI
jgi:hypothetical protein